MKVEKKQIPEIGEVFKITDYRDAVTDNSKNVKVEGKIQNLTLEQVNQQITNVEEKLVWWNEVKTKIETLK